MPRPASKVNPLKKTFYLEKKTLDRLIYLAADDKRSPSQYLENLIEADWLKKQKPKS